MLQIPSRFKVTTSFVLFSFSIAGVSRPYLGRTGGKESDYINAVFVNVSMASEISFQPVPAYVGFYISRTKALLPDNLSEIRGLPQAFCLGSIFSR